MPIYEYQCQSCAHRFEALQKISDQPLVDCPDCFQPELTKLVSAAAFKLKGSGWYETDFKNNGKSQQKSDNGDSSTAKQSSSGGATSAAGNSSAASS